jgi:hypothetical protein
MEISNPHVNKGKIYFRSGNGTPPPLEEENVFTKAQTSLGESSK